MGLQVLTGGRADVLDAYEPRSGFDLRAQPARPGLAHEQLELALEAQEVAAIEAAASAEGVPTGLWASIVIESERVLCIAAEATGAARPTLEAVLNDASTDRSAMDFVRRHGRRLAEYARALRNDFAEPFGDPRHRLAVPVGYHTLVAWEIEAGKAGKTLEQWGVGLLIQAPAGRARWEAAAAESGQTLGEWVAVEAARRFSIC
jgi:hypothetical protein